MATSLPSMTSTHVYAFDQRISFTPASQLGEWQPGVRNYLAAAFPNITAPLIGASDAVTFVPAGV